MASVSQPGRPERDRNAVKEIPRSPDGATWGSGGNPEKRQWRDVGRDAGFADLLEENLDEATFLWGRWESELASPTRNLDEVWSWTEDRLHGAIDGLLVTETLADATVERALSSKDRSYQTLAAHLLTVTRHAEARARLATVLCETEDVSTLNAMIRGIEVAQLDGTFSRVTRALLKQGPQHCAALARLKSFQRATLGDELHTAYEADAVPTRIAALRAAGSLPDPAVKSWIDRGLRESDPAARVAAIESGIRQRQKSAWDAARAMVAAGEPGYESLLRWIAIFGQVTDHAWVYTATSEPGAARQAFWALGHVGTRAAVEHCLASMREPRLGRIAGETYVSITGADLVRDRLSAPEPEDSPSLPPFEAEDLDADLVPRREDLWSLPDPEACATHWASIEQHFAPETRYVRGMPFTLSALMESIAQGPMLRRDDYALELYVRTSGICDIETRAAGPTQRRMMKESHHAAAR